MKKITNKQARIIAKELIRFTNKYVAWWDIDEKPTISGVAKDIKETTQAVYDWLSEYQLSNIQNDELVKDADMILDMLRYPEYIGENAMETCVLWINHISTAR